MTTSLLRILMVEDSEDNAALLAREIRRGGYDIALQRVDSPSAMAEALERQQWDLVICDYSMPHSSGTDALNLLRARDSETPFIFVSGTIGEDKAVAALKMGAQDYVMKDNLRRLLPSIQKEVQEAAQRRERKRLEQEVQRLQKFEAIGRLAGGIAHDFNNALGVILGWAQMAYEEAPPDSPLQKKLQIILEQARHSTGLTSQLLAFARHRVLQARNINLNDLVSETTSLLKSLIGKQIELTIRLTPDESVIRADSSQIEQVLMNLCLNAKDAMPGGGHLLIATEKAEINEDYSRTHTHTHTHTRTHTRTHTQTHSYASPGKYVLLTVSDTGTGMQPETLDHIFEPFFTTKEAGKGTGLGLATVYGIVKQHGGFVNVYSEPGHGTVFHIYLPAGSGAPETRSPVRSETFTRGTGVILVAEDHEALREVAGQTLASLGYQPILASSGLEALRLFETNAKEIRLAILDVVMPGMSGPETYTKMAGIQPGLPVIFTSGYTAEVAVLNHKIEQGAAFLPKPYSQQALARAVQGALSGRSLGMELDS